jgi:hypothetical protein
MNRPSNRANAARLGQVKYLASGYPQSQHEEREQAHSGQWRQMVKPAESGQNRDDQKS